MRKFLVAATCIATLSLGACQQGAGYSQNSNTYQGAAAGALLGAVAGALTGDGSTETRQRATIGALAGAVTGGGIGQYMDRQEQALRKATQGTGIDVQRRGDNILLNMPNSITFDVDKSNVKPSFNATLQNIAGVLNQYPQTQVNIVGHTDSTGASAYNQNLSLRRANSVSSYLRAQGVAGSRLQETGAGEDLPVADNGTIAGRAANRRVEVQISPVNAQ